MATTSKSQAAPIARRKRLPGTTTSTLHFFLKTTRLLKAIPPLAVATILVGMAGGLAALLRVAGWPLGAALSTGAITLLFGLGDAVLLHVLPRAGISYGPVAPPLLMLFALRCIAAFGLGPSALLGAPVPALIVASLLFQAAGTGLAIRGFWVEPQRLDVSRIHLASPRLSPGRSLRILHLADLHIERLTARDQRVVEHAHRLNPDLILFSGDLVNISNHHDPTAHAGVVEFFERLPRPPLGIFAVSGSPAVDLPDEAASLYSQMPHVRWLRDERIVLQHGGDRIQLLGVGCTHDPDLDAPRLAAVHRPLGTFTVLLYHSPDLALNAARLGVDLQLSGHTHGGQVRLPFVGALVTGLIGPRYLQTGLVKVRAMWLYVSRGIGMEGMGAPRIRFLCLPEIALIEVEGELPERRGDAI